MALSTYTDLQTAIVGHLRRGDLTAQIPDFIRLGEARLNRLLRLLQQETTTTLTASTTTRFVNLPANFLEVLSLTITVSGEVCELYPLSADKMDKAITSASGIPSYYRISDRIEFECIADSAYPLNLRMLKRWNLETDDTNWLMTNCPDCYIYASLLAASPYIKDDSRMVTWRELLSAAIEEANELDSRTRADVIATMDSGLIGGSGYDIESDR